MNSRWIGVTVLVLAACTPAERQTSTVGRSAGGSQNNAPDATVARSDAGASDATASDAAAMVSARLNGVPATIPAGEAVIIAATPGATVTMRREGAAAIELGDGERVRVIEELVGLDAREQAVEVEARSMRGLVANTAVLTEERLRRSRDGRWAVFHALGECGDFCHARLTLLGPDATRRSLCGDELCASPEWNVAFSADGTTVAVGSVDLRLATLSDGAVRTVEGFGSPAFSPQGRLFARNLSARDDGVYEIVASGEARRVFAPRGRPPRRDPEVPTAPPSAPVLEGDGAVLCASFARGARWVVARATLDGRPSPGAQPCAQTP